MAETSFFQDLVAGTTGGVCGIVVGQPADTVKVRMQAGGVAGGPFSIASQIVRNEGVRGLFKGIFAPICANAPINAVIFVVRTPLVFHNDSSPYIRAACRFMEISYDT